MAEQTGKNLPSTEAKLNELVHRLKDAEAANLVSVILYGSAARSDFHPDHSDLNVLCVLKSLALEELGRAAPVVRWWVAEQKQPAPLFFTAEELRQSADVFSIELKDMQDSRRILFGADPIADLHLPMNLHRIQLEHELRTVLLKIRNAYFRSHGNAQELTIILRESFSSVLTLLRHTIIAFGENAPAAPRDIIERAAALTGCDAAAFGQVLHLREHGEGHAEIVKVYGTYLSALESVIRAVDKHLPKAEWQRTRHAHS